jgi:hypothetical protein
MGQTSSPAARLISYPADPVHCRTGSNPGFHGLINRKNIAAGILQIIRPRLRGRRDKRHFGGNGKNEAGQAVSGFETESGLHGSFLILALIVKTERR